MHTSQKVVSLRSFRESTLMETKSEVRQAESVPSEQRTEPRVTKSDRLFVQITQTADKGMIGKTSACKVLDTSAHGFRFITSEHIPAGSLLDLWVDDSSRPGKFFLSGDVRWSRTVGTASTMVGVRLQEGLATDIADWQEMHES